MIREASQNASSRIAGQTSRGSEREFAPFLFSSGRIERPTPSGPATFTAGLIQFRWPAPVARPGAGDRPTRQRPE